MSDKRFLLCQDDLGNYEIRYDDKIFHFLWEVAPILNEQQDKISELEEELEKSSAFIIEQRKENKTLKEENEQLRHELDSLTGCYCADNKEFKDYWRIGYDD